MGSAEVAEQDRIAWKIGFAVTGWIQSEIDRAEQELTTRTYLSSEDIRAICSRLDNLNAARAIIGRMPLSVIADQF